MDDGWLTIPGRFWRGLLTRLAALVAAALVIGGFVLAFAILWALIEWNHPVETFVGIALVAGAASFVGSLAGDWSRERRYRRDAAEERAWREAEERRVVAWRETHGG